MTPVIGRGPNMAPGSVSLPEQYPRPFSHHAAAQIWLRGVFHCLSNIPDCRPTAGHDDCWDGVVLARWRVGDRSHRTRGVRTSRRLHNKQ